MKRSIYVILSLVVVFGMLLSACQTTPAPTAVATDYPPRLAPPMAPRQATPPPSK